MKNNKSKINNGCINIFRFLVLLYNDEASYSNVYNIFKSDIVKENEIYDEKKLNNLIQVVINKYVNALKIFGIKVKKENHKFKLDSSLYSVNYTLNDLKALSILFSAGEKIPDNSIHKNIKHLKENLLLRMNNTDKNTLATLGSNRDFSFFYMDLKEQIQICKDYCRDNVILDLTYLNKNNEIRCICKPKEITYSIKTAYLNVYDTKRNENIEIALPNILSVDIMPGRSRNYESSTTIVYKLKGRLAKTYKLKECEKLQDKTDDVIFISNCGEPINKLFSRLMRYADLCEIVSPKYIRNEMMTLIDETINNYEK